MTNKENLMAAEKRISPFLAGYYLALPSFKEAILAKPEITDLFEAIHDDNPRVAKVLKKAFMSGKPLIKISGGEEVIDYWMTHSAIIPALAGNPGTFTMLEKMYHFEEVHWPIDIYFFKSIPGGQALRARFEIVNQKTIEFLNEIASNNHNCLMLDIGSGPGRNGMEISVQVPKFADKIQIDCIDTDEDAIAMGKKLLLNGRYGHLKNITFIQESMTKLRGRYRGNVDFALLIGILCGLTFDMRVGLLKAVRPYFKRGGLLVSASLLDEMLRADLFCSYVLKETAGWILQYPPLGELRKVYELAGYEYLGYFQEETRLYEIGIGRVP